MALAPAMADDAVRRAEALRAEARQHKRAARYHRRMAAEKLAELERFCAEVGIDLDLGTAEGGKANVNESRPSTS